DTQRSLGWCDRWTRHHLGRRRCCPCIVVRRAWCPRDRRDRRQCMDCDCWCGGYRHRESATTESVARAARVGADTRSFGAWRDAVATLADPGLPVLGAMNPGLRRLLPAAACGAIFVTAPSARAQERAVSAA